MKNSIQNVAKEIASDNNGSIQKNMNTYSIYSKEGGWIGAVDKNGNCQGVASNYMISYDCKKGWLNEGHYV